jgi:hypothetical protein
MYRAVVEELPAQRDVAQRRRAKKAAVFGAIAKIGRQRPA